MQGLQASSLHPRLIAALLSESADLNCQPEFQGLGLETEVPFTRCIRQGGVESTFERNCVIHRGLGLLVPIWRECDYGLQLGDKS